MPKLTRYTSFEDLKSDEIVHKSNREKNRKLMSAFKSFLNSLKKEFSIQEKNRTSYGKRIS